MAHAHPVNDVRPTDGEAVATDLDGRLARLERLEERIAAVCGAVAGRIAFSTSLGLEDQAILHAIAADAAPTSMSSPSTPAGTSPRRSTRWSAASSATACASASWRRTPPSWRRWSRATACSASAMSVEARKACCDVRKVRPLRRALAGAAAWITGLRRGQSAGRGEVAFAAWDDEHGLIKVNPLADWSLEQLDAYIAGQRHSGQRAARARLPLDRLPALHARHPAWRGHPRRPLVVGAARTARNAGCTTVRARRRGPPHDRAPVATSTCSRPRASTSSARPRRSSAGRCCCIRSARTSTVLLHLARKAFYPAKPPFPLLHVDTTWKFRDMIAFRDRTVRELGLELIVHTNAEGVARGINPIDYPPSTYTDVMKTQALRQALDAHAFDAAFGGARRDEEASRAKERVFSFRSEGHRWDPRRQRPEMWRLLNGRLGPGETARVFPLSNWTEKDVWRYIARERLDVVPLYFAAERPTIVRNGSLLVLDDDRMPLRAGESVAPAPRALPHARLLAADGGRRVRRRRSRQRGGRDARGARLRAPGPPHRPRRGRRHGAQEAGGVFLMSALAHARDCRGSSAPAARRAGVAPSAGAAAVGARRRRQPARADLRLGRRRQVDADRPHAVGCGRPARRPAQHAARAGRGPPPARPISACWSTASPPSASRASPSTWPGATSIRRRAGWSSSTARATSSTRATWRPAPRTPTWPSCWSTRAPASRSRRGGTRPSST